MKTMNSLKKKFLAPLALVLLCYIAAALKMPFLFIIFFFVLCHGLVLLLGVRIYYWLLPKRTREKYSEQQIRLHLIVAGLMIFFYLGRSAINDYYMSQPYSVLRISAKIFLLVACLYLGRRFLIKGWEKTAVICLVIYSLFIVLTAIRTSIKFESGRIEGKNALKALRTLGYASWAPLKDTTGKSSVTVYDKESCYNGFNIYASKITPGTHLMDMEGKILHTWFLDPNKGYPGFYCSEVMENGDLLAIVSKGKGFVRLGKDSKIKWEAQVPGHHDFYVDDNGDIYVLARKNTVVLFRGVPLPARVDYIVVLSSKGETKKNIPLYPIFKKHVSFRKIIHLYKAIIDPSTFPKIVKNKLCGEDIFASSVGEFYFLHTNAVELMKKNIDGVCKKGDILVSSRDLSFIGIFNVEKQKFVWMWGHGQISGQHQPTLLDNGNIMLLDNGWTSRNYSRVIEVNPVTREIEWEYRANPRERFYTLGMGSNQRLPNGNTLVTESCSGRVFEITTEGKIVWEFYNPNIRKKAQKRETIYRLTRVSAQLQRFWEN